MVSDSENFFRARRARLGLTQRAIANTLGVTITTIGNWERGANLPRVSQYDRVAEVYGVSADRVAKAVIDITRRRQPATASA